ncbi:MAG: helix-hairpin-helix domain-containing protein [Bacteroidota bacterium]
MDFWNELFNELDDRYSYIALFWLAGAAFIGWLIGMISRWIGVSRWKKRYRQKESELKKAQADLAGFKEKYDLQEADLQKANLNIEELRTQTRVLEQDKLQFQNDLAVYEEQYGTLKADYEKMQTEQQSYLTKIGDLEAQLVTLEDTNKKLNKEATDNDGVLSDFAAFQSSFNATKNQLTTMESRLAQLEEENAGLKDEVEALSVNQKPVTLMSEGATDRSLGASAAPDALTLSMIEEKLSAIEDENIMLKKELNDLKAGGNVGQVLDRSVPRNMDEIIEEEEMVDDEVEEKDAAILQSISPEEQSARASAKLQAALGHSIPVAGEADKDDLKKINGIGPFIEQKLNSLGIYTYEQVSRLDDELIDTLTTAIQFFPGRIKRDDWVGQATALLGSSAGDTKNTSVSKAGASPDDLKVVEGIGPKIEQLLKDNGIRTWEELSNTEVSRLREILEAAGSRYRMHSPTTWPDQAKLASLGQWEKLEEFQGYLTGGKDPSK